jgi:hypothetical protein
MTRICRKNLPYFPGEIVRHANRNRSITPDLAGIGGRFSANPKRLACLLAFLLAGFVLPAAAQPAARPPISQVQMEKLLRVIDQRGQNVRLNDDISGALGLGDNVIVRQATAADPVERRSYFFATVPATGQYLIGNQDVAGGDIFLLDPDLRPIAGISTHGQVQKIPLPEAGKKARDVLEKFGAFLEMN